MLWAPKSPNYALPLARIAVHNKRSQYKTTLIYFKLVIDFFCY
jgi:hypothetical protein